MADRPHIVIFNPDQFRGDALGHMGNPAARTPNLDRAVETDAVSFRWAFCQNPVCTPSRCSFMTGWYPHTHGHRTMHYMLHEHEPVLLENLKDAGYYVWWGGKNDLVPAQFGYDHVADVKYEPPPDERPMHRNAHAWNDWRGDPEGDNFFSFYYGKVENITGDPYVYDHDWAMVEGAIDLIKNPPTDKPLCIYLPLSYPHPPYAVEDPWYSMIDPAEIPDRIPRPDWSKKPSILKGIWEGQGLQGWDEDRWRELRRTYYGMCSRIDHQYGMILDALREAGIYDDTAVFFFADHGDFTGDYGLVEKTQNTFEDCLTRVPFIIKPPASVNVQPRVSDAMVELIDFPATVEAITGVMPDHWHFGRSLVPVLEGQTEEHRDATFCQGGRLMGETQAMELASGQDPKGLYSPRLRLQRKANSPEHSKATMCRTKDYKYVHRLYEKDELYDLKSDPKQLYNRIDDPSMAEIRAKLKDRLLEFYISTSDVVPFEADKRH